MTVRSKTALIDLTADEPALGAGDFLRRTALVWGATEHVCGEMAAIGADLVRGVLAHHREHPSRRGRSREATLRVRCTSAGMAVAEIWDVRVPTDAVERRAHGKPYRARPHRPPHRFYRLARLRIGAPQADGPAATPGHESDG